MTLDMYITTVYCYVDDFLRDGLGSTSIRTRGESPLLNDAEVITMEIVGEYLSLASDKHIWAYFKRHWHPWFPRLGCRTSFVRQCANIWYLKELIQKKLIMIIYPISDDLFIFDGFPIPTCHIKRA